MVSYSPNKHVQSISASYIKGPLAEIQSQEGGSYEEHISARWTNVTPAVQTAEWAETPSPVWCGEVSQGAAGGGGLRGGPAPALPHPGGRWAGGPGGSSSRGAGVGGARCRS